MDAFEPHHLLTILRKLPATPRYRVAFSGGMDSTVLLHALVSLRTELGSLPEAIHVDHAIHPDSCHWSRHCLAVCKAWQVPCLIERVDATPHKGESPEAAARRVRYNLFARLLEKDELLLTAHHQDDQAETLLLQLLRGAGVHGLAAMPRCRPLAMGHLLRPLLSFPRAALERYARHHALDWIEDPSNADTGLERNFLRHQIMPLLQRRRVGSGAVLARSAGHFSESAELLDEIAHDDLKTCSGAQPMSLSIICVSNLSPSRRNNLLRYWIRAAGLPLPDSKRLQQIVSEVIDAAADRIPRVAWPGAEVRRYRDALHVMAPLSTAPDRWQGVWEPGAVLRLPAGLGWLDGEYVNGHGLGRARLGKVPLTVRFRWGGERCRPAGRGGSHTLKNLFQEAGVSPWMRRRWPLIFVGETLAALPGLWVCEPFAASTPPPGWGARRGGRSTPMAYRCDMFHSIRQ